MYICRWVSGACGLGIGYNILQVFSLILCFIIYLSVMMLLMMSDLSIKGSLPVTSLDQGAL